MNEALSHALLLMKREDLAVRAALLAEGALQDFDYHPRMEAVHQRHSARLEAILVEHGWPAPRLVGEEGAEAAWLIAQHSIGNPPLMRKCLTLLRQAAAKAEVAPWHAALLEDRIRMYEGKPQVYGTQFEPDERGELEPYAIENPLAVNALRQSVGLNTIEERTAQMRRQNHGTAVAMSPDAKARYAHWLRTVGWR